MNIFACSIYEAIENVAYCCGSCRSIVISGVFRVKPPWQICFQKQILERYAKEHGIKKYKFYVDDGISGTTFNRPGFQEMLADIEAGYVYMVVVKDMSRFGRDYLQVGMYTETLWTRTQKADHETGAADNK